MSLEPFGVEVGLDVLAETVGIQFSGGGGECPTNCVNPVIHITLEELMNHGINNERQRRAGHGRQGGW